MSNAVEQLKQQIRQLNELARDGVLPEDQVQVAKARLEKQLLDVVMATDAPLTMASETLPTTASDGVQKGPRIPVRMVAAMTGFVLAVGAAGYAWLGQPEAWGTGPGASSSASAADAADGSASETGRSPHSTDASQIAAMTDSLAAKLKTDPQNAEGWAMLARSYAVLGRFDDATPAYQKAIALRPDDAQLYADYADAMAARQDHKLDGEPTQLVDKALKLDPNNFKALFLSGTMAFDAQDFKKAAELWERALKHTPADNPGMSKQLLSALNDARQRLGLPPQSALAANGGAASQANAVSANSAVQVAGQVTLAKEVLAQVGPSDTVFIFARAAQGPKMPLAVMRRQVKDLPTTFSLTDAMAMSDQLKLSDYPEVVVGARVSRSGQAMPQPGDWQALSAPVKLGTKDIQIDIREVLK